MMSSHLTFPRKAETLDAYRAEVKAQIKERKENEGKAKKEDQAVEQGVANAEIDLPEPMVDLQAKQMADDFARRIMQQGTQRRAVLPVHRSLRREDDGRA